MFFISLLFILFKCPQHYIISIIYNVQQILVKNTMKKKDLFFMYHKTIPSAEAF